MTDHQIRETPREIQSIYEGLIKGGAKLFTKLRDDQKKRLEVSTESIEDAPEEDTPNISISRDGADLVTLEPDVPTETIRDEKTEDRLAAPVIVPKPPSPIEEPAPADYEPITKESLEISDFMETRRPVRLPEEATIAEEIPSLTEARSPSELKPEAEDRSATPVVYPGFRGATISELREEETSMASEPIGSGSFNDIPFIEVIRVDEGNKLVPILERDSVVDNGEIFGDQDDEDRFYSGNPGLPDDNIPITQVIRASNPTPASPTSTVEEEEPTEGRDTLVGAAEQGEYNPLDKKSTPENDFTNLSNELLFKNSGQDPIDKLTKEDAKAIAMMLNGEIGENIPNAANLKIMVDGKVVAQADAQGRLITREQSTSTKLEKYFASLAKEEDRPSIQDGSDRVQKASEESNASAPGHQFMRNLVDKMKVQESAYMPTVTQKQGLIETEMASVDTILNLYATKGEDEENYQLKNGGVITSQTGGEEETQGYQFFEVRDAEGNIDMGFTVCPDGQILVDPRISNKLQNEIAEMQKAWDNGEISEDIPLMTEDKARADAVQGFAKNIQSAATNDAKNDSNASVEVTRNKKNQIVATNKKNPDSKMIVAQGTGGKIRILSNSLNTKDMMEFNERFEEQKLKNDTAKTDKQETADGNDKQKVSNRRKPKPSSAKSKQKRQGQGM